MSVVLQRLVKIYLSSFAPRPYNAAALDLNLRFHSAKCMNRRDFIKITSSIGLAATTTANSKLLAAHHKSKRNFTLAFYGGSLGIQANQRRAIQLASQFGFESVEAQSSYLADLSQGEADELIDWMKDKNIVWGSSRLPVDFRKDLATFEEGLAELPKRAAGLKRAGVSLVNTWIQPYNDDLTYNENFKQHTRRLLKVARILGAHDLRLGFEYVGTTTLLIRGKYPFLHTLAETQELVAAIGTGNVGYVLDSWHWWQAGDSAEAIHKIDPSTITLVDLNDAPKGVDKQQQMDNARELPLATGVIEIKPFLEALVKIGYTGPARAEPFNQPLRDLDDDAASMTTITALKKAAALIGG